MLFGLNLLKFGAYLASKFKTKKYADKAPSNGMLHLHQSIRQSTNARLALV